jgi:hypothetical protein
MKNLVFASILILLCGVSVMEANAGSASGTITVYHLNNTIPNRVACIQMAPALPTGWACIYSDQSIYKEINALLLTAYMSGKYCQILWDTTDGSYAKISAVFCY